jgi:hypothetical protein
MDLVTQWNRVASDVQSSGERTFETADVPQKNYKGFSDEKFWP